MADLVFAVRGTAEVIAEHEKIAQQQGKQKTLAKELSAEYAANEAELKKLGRTAQQIYSANETSAERYSRKLAETKAALQGNTNEAELLKRATTSLTVEYLKQTDGSTKLTTAQQHQLDVKRKYQEQLQHEIQMLPQLTSETHKLMGEYDQSGKSLEKVSAEHHKSFGAEAAADLAKYAAGALTIEKAYEAVAEGVREVSAEIKKAADATLNNLGALGQLQLVSGSKEDFQKNLGFARNLERLGIVKPGQTGQAADITTALARAHISDSDRETLVKLAESKTITAEQMEPLGVGARAAQEIWGPSAGGFDQVTNQLLKASTIGKMDPGELATFIQKFGRTAQAAGVPFNEALTGGAVVTRTAATGKAAASRIQKYYEGFGDQDAAVGKSDDKIKELEDKLAFDQSERAKQRAKRLVEHQTKEAERQKEFDEHEADRIVRVRQEMADAATSMQRAQDDLEKQKSKGETTHQRELDDARESLKRAQMEAGKHGGAAAGMRVKDAQTRISRILADDKNDPEGPERRLQDAQQRIDRLNAELKPKQFKAGRLEDLDDGSGIDNIQRELAAERAKRAQLIADAAAARKKGHALAQLSPEEQQLFKQNLPLVTGAGAPASYIESDPRLAAAKAREAEEGRYHADIASGYETKQSLVDAAYTARMRDASSRGWVPWAAQGVFEHTAGYLMPQRSQIESGVQFMTPEGQAAARQYLGQQNTGQSMDDLAKLAPLLEKQNEIARQHKQATINLGNKLEDGAGAPVNSGE